MATTSFSLLHGKASRTLSSGPGVGGTGVSGLALIVMGI
jgi:hypothetical protein